MFLYISLKWRQLTSSALKYLNQTNKIMNLIHSKILGKKIRIVSVNVVALSDALSLKYILSAAKL